jgi:hypothetical protein
MKEKIGTFYFEAAYIDFNFDHSDIENPGKSYRNKYKAFVSNTRFKLFVCSKIKLNIYHTLDGIFEEIHPKSYFSYDRPSEIVHNKD